MMKICNNIIGKKYGKLTVLDKSTKKSGHYVCRCDCGNIIDRKTGSLTSKTKKEKCCRKCHLKPKEYINEIPDRLFSHMKYTAKKRNIKFSSKITKEFIFELLKSQNHRCKLSGVPLIISGDYKKCNISLDRIRSVDKSGNKSAYTTNNVCLVSKKVNLMKGCMSDQEFINWCKIISENNKKGKN